jgi:TonB-linked SusC/RagA family outer membrane protein
MKFKSSIKRWVFTQIKPERKTNMRRNIALLSVMLAFFISATSQTNRTDPEPGSGAKGISGTVTDDTGMAIIGASVKVKADIKTGTITNFNGVFSLPALNKKTVLVVSYIGYENKEVTIEPGIPAQIVLIAKNIQVNELVVVGYGTQKKINVTGALATISSKDMLKSPVVNATQALVGRATGVFSRQNSGQPGNDNVAFRIRGSGTYNSTAALVVVDGVERDFSQLDMNEIESMTVLKDAASTAVYGVRGANGVIVVTTKQGKEGPAKVTYSANFGLNQAVRLPKFANSYDYALLRNEGELNDNPLLRPEQLCYSAIDLAFYKSGIDPIYHPNIDWFDKIMNKYSTQTQHNINISGGSKLARYYVSLGYQNQDGLYKNFNEAYGYSNNDHYQRYNVRTNVDVNLTPTTRLNFNIGSITGITNRDLGVNGTVYSQIATTAAPYSPGVVDGKIVYLEGRRNSNLIATMSTGFTRATSNKIQSNIGLDQKLDFITKGLSARVKYSYDTQYSYSIQRSRTPAIYIMKDSVMNDIHTPVYKLYNSTDPSLGGLSSTSFSSRSIKEYLEAGLSYDRNLGDHHISELLLYNQNKQRFNVGTPSSVPVSYLGLVERLTYNYQSRYFFEFNLGYNGSENFAEGRRFGLFPAFSGGWLISEEAFFRKLISEDMIDHLKLRASYGVVGNDLGGSRFLYYPSKYSSAYGARFGEDYSQIGGYIEDKLGNPYVTWEKAHKQDYGFDLKMLKQRLSLTFDYFYEKRNDILGTRNTVPAMFAATSAVENLGIMKNSGLEFDLGWEDKIGSVRYYIKGNYSFARNKVLFTDEAIDALNPYLAKTGHRNEQPFGYKFIGFFSDADDVAQSPVQFSGVSKPGDAKYADINGDGVINVKDQIPIGYPTYPEINYGFSGGISYKGFDLDFLFQGTTNVSVMLDGFIQQPGMAYGQILASVKDERWTPATANTATRPILTVNYANQSNYYASTLWQKDASYLRLKNLQLAYTFNDKISKSLKLSNLKIFVNGQNLITWDKLKIVDPENGKISDINYPQVAVYNFGINLQF